MSRKLLVAFLALLPSAATAESWVNRVQVTSPVVGQYMAGIDAKGIPILEAFGSITPTLDDFTGDSGSGGAKGVVPAPAAGDAAANKFLKADGTWATTPLSTPVLTKSQEINYQTGTTYTVLSSDNNKLLAFSNASGVNVTLPQPTGSFDTGWWVDVRNVGAGRVTVYPQSSAVVGESSPFVLPQGYSVRLVSDGTNYIPSGFSPLRGRILLRTFTANSSASVGDASVFDSAFEKYDIEFDHIVASSASANLQFQVYAGGSYQSSGYLMSATCSHNGGYVYHCGAFTTGVLMNSNTLAPTENMTGKLTIDNPLGSGLTHTIYGNAAYKNGAYFITLQTGGIWNNTTIVTGFRIIPTAGLLTGGTVKVYGYN